MANIDTLFVTKLLKKPKLLREYPPGLSPAKELEFLICHVLFIFFFSERDVRPSAAKLLKEDPFVNFTEEEQSRLAWLFS